ncbi:MAG: tRNA uridine-5-carboxymethylaminomethyl(34) synthesis enzyme MnmG [Eubacteriales bacterium]
MTYDYGTYDVIVVGAGHAGCEAALAAARLNMKTLMLTINLDSVALMACNPAIGGTSKGHLVREIDALGGEMGKASDETFIQIKMLNTSKGEAVKSLRAQMDKKQYHTYMKSTLERTDNLEIRQAEAAHIMVKGGKVSGIITTLGAKIYAHTVILCTGVYLKSRIIVGETALESGPAGFFGANSLSNSLIELGFSLQRFKTGTPARVDRRSLDFSKMEIQRGDEAGYAFSFMSPKIFRDQEVCYLTYTNETTHNIIRENIHRSPLFSGMIEGTGPRYCPSIEDKVVKFPDKVRHQLFLEPEGKSTSEMYVQGMSSSLPEEVQLKIYRSVRGMENVIFTRTAYAIEYDAIDSKRLKASLETKDIPGLFMAGQINGTSGYEEAAAQGIIAGINASMYIKGEEPIILDRSNAYAGVLIDDLITKGTKEPYRMMTARAEYRLYLRQGNADMRLTEMGRRVGLVDDKRYDAFMNKREAMEKASKVFRERNLSLKSINELLKRKGEAELMAPTKAKELLKRPQISYTDLLPLLDELSGFNDEVLSEAATEIKYEGYLKKQQRQIDHFKNLEKKVIPSDIDFSTIPGLRLESRQKLNAVKPENLGQAGRISGVSPADISVLIVYLSRRKANV